MQLLLIKHAKPRPTSAGEGADPNLSYDGNEQTRRLPDALSKFTLSRIVSSPSVRAQQTAGPVADQLGMVIDIDQRLADYDHGLEQCAPGGEAAEEVSSGDLPDEVNVEEFIARVKAAVDDIVAVGRPADTVAIFTHGGVISALLHTVMKTEQLFCVELDYTGVTRLKVSPDGDLTVASVNGTDHVWDVLYRTQWWSEEH
jgi:probable phosphoglycerate mutase